MRKYILFMFSLSALILCAQSKKVAVYPVAFYNLENLFDTINQPGVIDEDFTPDGKMKWTSEKYQNKINNLAYAISRLATDNPLSSVKGAAIIGVSEIENEEVMHDLVNSASLAKRKYKIVHYNSPDRRGIDVGLIYDPARYKVKSSKSYRLVYPADTSLRTRDQLLVSGTMAGNRVHVIVNHWPSRIGGEEKSRPMREASAALTRHIADSIMAADPNSKIIIMGDLNDDPDNSSCKDILAAEKYKEEVKPGGYFNTMWQLFDQGIGSLTYQGKWNLFDQIIISENLLGKGRSALKFAQAEVFNRDFLRQTDGKYKGYPKRTHAGGTYLNGYSDHFPTIIYLVKEKK